MLDFSGVGAALVFDALLQSTIVFAAGLLIARSLRLPARAHAVLATAFACALVTPLASSMVRQRGWGLLAPLPVVRASAPVVAERSVVAAGQHTEKSAPLSADASEQDFAAVHSMPNFEHPPRAPQQSATPAVASSAPSVAAVVERSAVQPASAPVTGGQLRSWSLATVAGLWGLGTLLVGLKLVTSMRGSRRLLAGSEPCASPTVDRALQLARERLGLGALQIEVRVSPEVRCPVIWCWRRHPLLVLPCEAAASWSTAAWTPILCHELAHWLRRDHVWALAAECVCCLLPWQPLAWWAKRRLEHASEQACDEWAIASGHSAADYAETLLGLVAQPGSPLQLAALRRRSGLGMRVRHILTTRVPRPRLGRAWAVTIALAATGIVSTAAFCQRGVAHAEESAAAAVSDSKTADDKPAAENKEPASESGKEATKPPAAPATKSAKPTPAMTGGAMKGSTTKTTGTFVSGTSGAGATARPTADASTERRPYTAAGRILDPEGKPVVGATLTWEARIRTHSESAPWNTLPTNLGEAKTDADGKFSLTAELIEQDVISAQLMIRAAGFGLRGYITVLQKLAHPLEIKLDPSYPIEGTIFTPNGDPVRGARVTMTQIQRSSEGEEPNLEKPTWWFLSLTESELKSGSPRAAWPAPVLTDENGTFRFADDVPIPASARLMIAAENYALTPVHVKHQKTILHPRDQQRDSYQEPSFTLVLETPWTVEGRFTDEKSGEPLAGVDLRVTQNTYGHGWNSLDDIRITTNEDGRYKLLAGSADYFQIRVTAPLGYPGLQNSLNATELEKLARKGRQVKYDVKLRRGTILRGKVVADDTGDPVADAQVSYRAEKGRKLGMNNEFDPVHTAEDGTFELTGTTGKGFLLVDAANQGFYRLVVDDKKAQRYQDVSYPHGIVEVDIPEEGQQEPVTIPLKRGRELVVRALSPSGEPVAKVTGAFAEQDMDRYFSSGEAKEGHFRINAAQPGRKYLVHLFSEDAMAGILTELEAPEDGHVIDVKLEPCATIRGRYVFSGGGPAAEVSNFPHFRLDPQQEEGDDFQIYNLPFYNNFARVKKSGELGTYTSDADGHFMLEGIVPGAFIYLSLNYKFEDGKTYRSVGTFAPGEVRDLGDLVIQSR